MTIEQMAPRDAQMYWMSTKIPNDQFLLFCFDSPTADLDTVRSVIAARAAGSRTCGYGPSTSPGTSITRTGFRVMSRSSR